MGRSRLSSACKACPFVDTCGHKRMEALAYYPDPYIASATEPVIESASAPILRETIKTGLGIMYKDELEKELYKSLYKDLYVDFYKSFAK